MIKLFLRILFTMVFITGAIFVGKAFACTGGTLAGNLTPNNNWQPIAGVQAGDRFTFTINAGEVIIFSFCQGGGSYTNDPRIDLLNGAGTISLDFNDDHCGYGAELVWVCTVSGTYSVLFTEFSCQTNSVALGTVSYKLLPTPTEQDCLGARPLCNSFTNHPQSYVGGGHYYDIFNFNAHYGMGATTNNCPNCLVTGELNNVWYTFTAQTNGNLAFTIDPIVNSDDYDWALYSLNGGVTCFDLINWSAHPPVSCNYSFGGNGNTGLGTGGSNCVGPVEDNLFNATFPITAGQTYVLTVSNFSSTQTGYSINFGASTASIVDNSGPQMTNLVYQPYCGSSSLTVQFSESIWCSSVQAGDFTLTGPAGTYAVDDVYSIVCMSASSNTYSGTWYDDVWTLQLGDLVSQSGDYVLSINSGSVEDKCGNVNGPDQLFFTIVGITADVNIVTPTGCNGEAVGALSVTNLSGGSPPYFIDWSGPNGFTSNLANISNLEPGLYTVTITDIEGVCEFIESILLIGPPAINPTATSNSPICEGETLNLTGGSDDAAATYIWFGPSAYTSNAQSPTRPVANPTMSGTYQLSVTDSWGCTAGATTDVTVYQVLPVSASSGSPYCTGETIQLNSTNVAGASYSWTGPNLYASNLEDPSIPNCATTHAGTYTVVVTNANGCTRSASTNVVVNSGLTLNLTTINPLCYQQASGQILANVASGSGTYSYLWSTGFSANPLTNCVGGTSYCVTVQDNVTGCSASSCHTLVDPPDLVCECRYCAN
jgi:hypothetical protein